MPICRDNARKLEWIGPDSVPRFIRGIDATLGATTEQQCACVSADTTIIYYRTGRLD